MDNSESIGNWQWDPLKGEFIDIGLDNGLASDGPLTLYDEGARLFGVQQDNALSPSHFEGFEDLFDDLPVGPDYAPLEAPEDQSDHINGNSYDVQSIVGTTPETNRQQMEQTMRAAPAVPSSTSEIHADGSLNPSATFQFNEQVSVDGSVASTAGEKLSPTLTVSEHSKPTHDTMEQYWIARIKEAFVTVENLPPKSEWGLHETTKSIMNTKFKEDIAARVLAGDADAKISAICEILFNSFIKYYAVGDHFDVNAMPNKSDNSKMDDKWTPDQRMNCYLNGLSGTKTLAGNLLSGIDAITTYVAKPEGRYKAIYQSAKGNAAKAMKHAKLLELESGLSKSPDPAVASSSSTAPATTPFHFVSVTQPAELSKKASGRKTAQSSDDSSVEKRAVQTTGGAKGTKGAAKERKRRGTYNKAQNSEMAQSTAAQLHGPAVHPGVQSIPHAEADDSNDIGGAFQGDFLARPTDIHGGLKRNLSSLDESANEQASYFLPNKRARGDYYADGER